MVKPLSEIAVVGLISGLALVLLLFFSLYFSGNSSPDDSHESAIKLSVHNTDMNRSHTLQIVLYDSLLQVRAKESYYLVPSKDIEATFHPTDKEKRNYSVTFLVDGNISSHYDGLAPSFFCSESFDLDPEQGVLRPYRLWCE